MGCPLRKVFCVCNHLTQRNLPTQKAHFRTCTGIFVKLYRLVVYLIGLEMFCFSVVKPLFCFAYVKFIAVPAISFVDNFRQLKTVEAVFVWKERFDATRVLKNVLEVDERVEVVNT